MSNSFKRNSTNFDDVLKRAHHEVGLLKEWMSKDFPESRLDVILDANNILMTLKITVRVLMGKEMSKDRGFFENSILLKESEVFDKDFMNQFFDAFGWSYRKEIARSINNYYNQQKEIEEAGKSVSGRIIT